MESKNYVSVSAEIAEDKSKLAEEAAREFGSDFEESKVDIEDSWTSYNVRLFEGQPFDQIVVFRPQSTSKSLGCIRVRSEKNTTKLWEAVQKEGVYMGYVPKACSFEAMVVEVKLITRKT